MTVAANYLDNARREFPHTLADADIIRGASAALAVKLTARVCVSRFARVARYGQAVTGVSYSTSEPVPAPGRLGLG